MTKERWPTIKLNKIANFKNGVNFNKSNFGQGIPVINVRDFQDYTYPHYETLDEINPEGVVKEKDLLLEDDIIFVRSNGNRDLIGRSLYLKNVRNRKVTHSAFTIRARFNSKDICPRFYSYIFKSDLIRKELSAKGGGTNINNLNQQILSELIVPLPSYDEQKACANILEAYDNLIENNSRRIDILEEMVKCLYYEWFVKFRFPGHENVKLTDSPQGKIPEGWRMVVLGNLIDVRKGKNITKKTISEGEVPVVAGGVTPAYYHNQANTCHPVITVSASGANAGFVNMYEEDIWASDCSYIDSEITPYVYYYYSLFKYRQAEITRMQRGSAQPHVYPKDLMRLEVLCVPEIVLDKYSMKVLPIFSLIKNVNKRNNNLKKQRDMILPKLISGDLNCNDKEGL